jgi:hypothetical protein
MANTVCGKHREMQNPREVNSDLIAALFFAPEMALQFNVDIVFTENCAQVGEECRCLFDSALVKRVVE